MKKQFLDQTEHLIAAGLPTAIFLLIFLGAIVWVFTRKQDAYNHIENLPLDD